MAWRFGAVWLALVCGWALLGMAASAMAGMSASIAAAGHTATPAHAASSPASIADTAVVADRHQAGGPCSQRLPLLLPVEDLADLPAEPDALTPSARHRPHVPGPRTTALHGRLPGARAPRRAYCGRAPPILA